MIYDRWMSVSFEEKEAIREALTLENSKSIYAKLMRDLKDTFRPENTDSPEMFDNSKEYEFDSRGLMQFAEDISHFEYDGDYCERYQLKDKNGKVYFDFLKDILDVGREIGYLVVHNAHSIYFRFFNLRLNIISECKGFLSRLDSTLFYYYQKDKYGTEACYGVSSENLHDDMLRTLSRLAPTCQPVERIRKPEPEEENDDEQTKARKAAISLAVQNRVSFPMFLITYPEGDAAKKYRCVQEEADVNYGDLIHRYAKSYEFKIPPTYIAANSMGPEAADRLGMGFLAQTMRERED